MRPSPVVSCEGHALHCCCDGRLNDFKFGIFEVEAEGVAECGHPWTTREDAQGIVRGVLEIERSFDGGDSSGGRFVIIVVPCVQNFEAFGAVGRDQVVQGWLDLIFEDGAVHCLVG